MPKQQKKITSSQILLFTMIALGVALIAVSAFYPSSSLAIIGMVIVSLGAVFLYVTPVKHVPLTLLNASAEVAVANIERLITELNLTEPGIYLPPETLTRESNLVFIPKSPRKHSNSSSDPKTPKFASEKTGVFVTPPGAALSHLFEKELGFSATLTDTQIQNRLAKLLVQDMGLAESAQIRIEGDTVLVELVDSVLTEVCKQADSRPRTHAQVGCLLSSAIACTLTRAKGRPITIINEITDERSKTTSLEYRILELNVAQLKTLQLRPLIHSQAFSANQSVEVNENAYSDGSVIELARPENFSENNDWKGNNREVKDVYSNDHEIELPPEALDYFKRHGEAFVLLDVIDPKYTYTMKHQSRYDNLTVNFSQFVRISREASSGDTSENRFITKAFGLTFNDQYDSLDPYVTKSGFSTVDTWVQSLKAVNEIPNSPTRHKLFYLYHVRAI